MAVARGSINHPLIYDIWNLLRSFFPFGKTCKRSKSKDKDQLVHQIREKFNVEQAYLFPFARSGIHATLKALRLPAGSEVLLTPITIGPVYEVIKDLDLKPVFVDLELDSFGPQLDDLSEKLKRSPGAFLLTYLFGSIPDLSQIVKLCEKHRVPIIEDFSHNIGGRFNGQYLGTFGVAGIYSASLLKYVDGYNGAFVVSNEARLKKVFESSTEHLTEPNPSRIRKIIFRTLIWNLSLSRHTFNLLTFPALRLLRFLSRKFFESLLGPSIKLNLSSTFLPEFYFEDICSLQTNCISKYLTTLPQLLENRRTWASSALQAYAAVGRVMPNSLSDPRREPTFWQFPIPVTNLQDAKDILFKSRIETGATNLMNLGKELNNILPNATKLKENYIFVPLHRHLSFSDYQRFFQTLKDAGLLTKASPTN